MTFQLNITTAEDRDAQLQNSRRQAIDVERERRIGMGQTVTVTDYGDIPVQGRPQDQINLLALKDTARDLKDAGVTDPVMEFRDGNNTNHMLTPAQMIEVANQGKNAASAIYKAAWDLKEMSPVPADYDDDRHWPA